MKVFAISLISIIILFAIYYTAPLISKRDETINIGMMSGWAPFMTINAQGNFEGFDVDVAHEVAKRLSKKSNIIDMGGLAPLFIALEKNKIDMILSGLDITQERLKKMSMIAYCGEQTKAYNLLFWNKIPENINTMEDFRNYPDAYIVVEPGVSAEKYLDQFDFIRKKQITSLADRLLELKYNKSLAMLIEPSIARQLMTKNPELKALSVPLPPDFQIYGMGIATKKDNKIFSEQIKNIIEGMRSDGTLEKLERKWQLEVL
jgi:arginine transport system substrate-binding protein